MSFLNGSTHSKSYSIGIASRSSFKRPEDIDIFKVKTNEEMVSNYLKFSNRYGKWNAGMYLTIINSLKDEDKKELESTKVSDNSRNATQYEVRQINDQATYKYESFNKKEYDLIGNKCNVDTPRECNFKQPKDPKRSYKNIFKHAKLIKSPAEEQCATAESELSDILLSDSAQELEQQKELTSESCSKKCEPLKVSNLVFDKSNNHLMAVRKSALEKRATTLSLGSTDAIQCLDQVDQYYGKKTMKTVLENCLGEQLRSVQANAHVSKGPDEDLFVGQVFKELAKSYLNDSENINQFQEMFDDSKWRKKFRLELLDDSDGGDSLDVSDIPLKEMESIYSDDSAGSEVNYKHTALCASRIPYIEEVWQKRDVLLDKIALKWEKIIEKNFSDRNGTPIFRHFSSEVWLRSCTPPFSDVVRWLEPYDDVYKKAFIPREKRIEKKLEKIAKMEEKKKNVVRNRREKGACQTNRNLLRMCEHPASHFASKDPTKYHGLGPRYILKQIIKDMKQKSDEGCPDFSREAFFNDYANLRHIIQTKNERNKIALKPVLNPPNEVDKLSFGSLVPPVSFTSFDPTLDITASVLAHPPNKQKRRHVRLNYSGSSRTTIANKNKLQFVSSPNLSGFSSKHADVTRSILRLPI